MPITPKVKKRKPQDSTLRNLRTEQDLARRHIRSLKTNLAQLERRVSYLERGAPRDERWPSQG